MVTQVDANRVQGAVSDAVGAQWEQLFACVLRRGTPRVDAEDIVQTGIQRALERAHQLRDPACAEAWVKRVVRNAFVDELRRSRDPVRSVDEFELATPEDDAIPYWCVAVQIDQLEPEYAELLRRVVVDGVPVTAVAGELGVTPNNATVRLHRARAALRQRLRSHCGTTTARACAECACQERGCCPRP